MEHVRQKLVSQMKRHAGMSQILIIMNAHNQESCYIASVIPNCITKAKSERRRPFVGNQIEECRDISGLFYILGFQKGYITNWDVQVIIILKNFWWVFTYFIYFQKTVWDYMFGAECFNVNLSETPLIISEPVYNFKSIQEVMFELLFEEYECENVLNKTAVELTHQNYVHNKEGDPALCCLVIDIGYSFTHIVPFIKNKIHKDGIKRIDIGGKMLTNHLMDLISYRQLNVMDESYVINQVKEDSCFVSQNFVGDMGIAKLKYPQNSIVKEYVLPDFTSIRRGYLRDISSTKDAKDSDHQILRLNCERFTIPEVLFHPFDIGLYQGGIPETVMEVMALCPEESHPHLLSNIIVCGGCAAFPGMEKRLQSDIRKLASDLMEVCVTVPEE